MDISGIKHLVETELARGEPFTNFHGITPATVRSFLVEPFTARICPDDLETQPRDMWVVLQERRAQEGYVWFMTRLAKCGELQSTLAMAVTLW